MSIITVAILFLAPLALAPAFSFYFDVVPKVAVVLFGVALLLIREIRKKTMSDFKSLKPPEQLLARCLA